MIQQILLLTISLKDAGKEPYFKLESPMHPIPIQLADLQHLNFNHEPVIFAVQALLKPVIYRPSRSEVVSSI